MKKRTTHNNDDDCFDNFVSLYLFVSHYKTKITAKDMKTVFSVLFPYKYEFFKEIDLNVINDVDDDTSSYTFIDEIRVR